MSSLSVVSLFCALFVIVSATPQGKYTLKYDNVDLDEILRNDRLLQNYYNCLVDKGKCTPDGSELKKVLPDALQSKCSKCSQKQREGSEKVVKYLIEHKPDLFRGLESKYDPQGVYRKTYAPELAERGIHV